MKTNQAERRGLVAAAQVLALVITAAGGAARAGEQAGGKGEGDDDEIHYLTGLDFSYWADGGGEILGPGLTWGLVLKPGQLDLLLTGGAMMGNGVYTVPVELKLDITWQISSWFDLFLEPGPTLLFDKFEGSWHHDLALSVSGGAKLSPVGYMWALRVGGDYNLRVWREVSNGGGFTVGFVYGF